MYLPRLNMAVPSLKYNGVSKPLQLMCCWLTEQEYCRR